jgi:hypothetical protein
MTQSLEDDEAAYAYVRMKLGNDEYSERVKFAFVVWQGNSPSLSYNGLACVGMPTSTGIVVLMAISRTSNKSHAQGQDVLPIRTGQAGDPDICRGDPDRRQEGPGRRSRDTQAEESHGREL